MTVLRACLLATVLLVLSAGTAAADHGYWPDGGVDPARVAGHRAQTDTNSAVAEWGADCDDRPRSRRGRGVDVYGYILDTHYRLVVVLAQTPGTGEPLGGPNGVTIFRTATTGQFVWADADGDSRFAGRHEADAGRMIFCGASDLPATDTRDVPSGPSLTLWGFGLVLGLLASLGAIASVIGRAASGSPPRRFRG